MIKLNREGVRVDLILPSLIALSITLLLFYIDEGRNSFVGIEQPENLIFLAVYGAVFFGFQQLVKMGLEYFIGNGKSQRFISGALASLILLFTLALFFLMIKPN